MKIGEQAVSVSGEVPGVWRWSIDYTKFRGRGQGAAEKIIGADGVVELRLNHGQGTERKTALFQAKNNWQNDPTLVAQCIRLSTWKEAAFVINYTPSTFEVFSIEDVLRSRGNRRQAPDGRPLQDFLVSSFIGCQVGDNDLSYDRTEKILIWKTRDGSVIATPFRAKHHIRLDVKAPSARAAYDRLVAPDAAYGYRMDASPEELLGLAPNFTNAELASAKKKAALVFHPDQFPDILQQLKDVLERRAQEENEAVRYLQEEIRDRGSRKSHRRWDQD